MPAVRDLSFYPRLALTNLKNNRQTYYPYLLTCILCVMTFYTVLSISVNSSFESLPSAAWVQMVMIQGVFIISIFSAILIFYTNGFLIRRRKRELGLYNILGMEKRHVGRMMLFETLFTALFAIASGLLLGIVFSRVMFLILLRMLHLGSSIAFQLSPAVLIVTAVLFAVIFLFTLLSNLRQVRLANPVELLHGGQVGEREPRTSWPTAIAGVLCLGGGYAIAVTVKSPAAAILLFFLAVMLVIAGTYALFTAGSIALLKTLRKNKKFYYRPKPFIAVSGLIYRMKQNAKGLASICILSTMVILTIATTLSLYAGQEGMLDREFGREVTVSARPSEGGLTKEEVDALVDETLAEAGVTAIHRNTYRYTTFKAQKQDGLLSPQQDLGPAVPVLSLTVLPLEDYNRMAGQNRTLAPGQALVFTDGTPYGSGTVTLGQDTWYVAEELDSFPLAERTKAALFSSYTGECYIVLPTAEEVLTLSHLYGGNTGDQLRRACTFDLEGDDAAKTSFSGSLQEKLLPLPGTSMNSVHLVREYWYSLYGGFFFLGVFLGALFMMATALIIYYKQLSEGFEDRGRFLILQQVGMSQKEVRSTIRSQILMVFFLPLAVALLHTAFAFPVMRTILTAFGLSDLVLFFLCTAGTALVFSLLYFATYSLTARTYYKLVGHTI